MKDILIVFSSIDGQTLKICNFIKTILEKNGHKVCINSIDDYHKIDMKYDFILVGASVRYGNYRKSVFDFIKNNINELSTVKNCFFSVSATARKFGKDIPENDLYCQKILNKTQWTPDIIKIFPGAIYYPKYNLFDRLMIKFIMYLTKGPTDTSQIFEFTNWDTVNLFAKKIVDRLES